MSEKIIQQIAEKLGATEPFNGSWIEAILQTYTSQRTGSPIIQQIAEQVGKNQPVNGSWLQAIAFAVGAYEPVNGNWLQAIVNKIGEPIGSCSPIQSIIQQIGAGTLNSSIAPAYGLYDYSWYAAIWRASEFTGGTTTERQITGIEVEVDGYTTPYTFLNQTIKLYHVEEEIFDIGPAIDLSDLTISDELTVKGNYTFTISSNGWQTIDFDDNFCYNGTDNLLLVWENRDGSWATGFGAGKYDSSLGLSRAANAFNDGSYPTGFGQRSNQRINIKFKY